MQLSELERMIAEAKTVLPAGMDPEIQVRIGHLVSDRIQITAREVFAFPVGAGRPAMVPLTPPPLVAPIPPEATAMGAVPVSMVVGSVPDLPPLYCQPKMLEIEGK
jgi:hypothetical protein